MRGIFNLGKVAAVLLSTSMSVACLLSVGCERKERLLDIETPSGGVKIERRRDGPLEIDVQREPDEVGIPRDQNESLNMGGTKNSYFRE